MNELQKLRDYNIELFRSDKLVNTITTLTDDLIDTNKDIIYPLVNIDYRSSTVQESVILANYKIKILDQNDIYTKTTDNKLLEDTNAQDILNETFNICQSYINSFRQYNDSGIELSVVSVVTPIINKELNGLSGHEFDITLSIPNEGTSCL